MLHDTNVIFKMFHRANMNQKMLPRTNVASDKWYIPHWTDLVSDSELRMCE